MSVRSRLGKADLHMHSHFSDGLGSVEDILAFVGQRTDLDVIAITDHNTIEGALRARDLVQQQGAPFEVIVGEEVSTREGHVLTLFIEKRIRPGLSVEQTIELAHQQGGLAIIAHPFNRVFRHSIQREVVDRLTSAPPEAQPDGMETLNGSFAGIGSSHLAMSRNRRHYRWPESGSSDAHTITAVGCAYTWFEGSSAAALRASLLQAHTWPGGHFWQTYEYWQLASYWTRKGRPGRPTHAERLRRLGQSPQLVSLRQVGQHVGQIARRPLMAHFSSRHEEAATSDLDLLLTQTSRKEQPDMRRNHLLLTGTSQEQPLQEQPLQWKGWEQQAPEPLQQDGWYDDE
jgi:predicted metal-dependent phosphoesterase TrpH